MTTGDGSDAAATAALPQRLVEGHRRWRAKRFDGHEAEHAARAAAQAPHTLVLTCSDSRVDPADLFDAAPGELFCVRNVGGLAPDQAAGPAGDSVGAAIEYAVGVLGVRTVLVLGHANCGAVAAACALAENADGAPEITPRLRDWLSQIAPSLRGADAHAGADRPARLERRAVGRSLARLAAYPVIAQRRAEGRLTLCGAWYDVASGTLAPVEPTDATASCVSGRGSSS